MKLSGVLARDILLNPCDASKIEQLVEAAVRAMAVEILEMVPRVGVEPTLPKEPDFESGASANSATWAKDVSVENRLLQNRKKIKG